MAAAAWSWVEKMLQLAHRTVAPRSNSVSMSTAVWMVMWREPVIRTPAKGWVAEYFLRMDIRPGISYSAIIISLRPHSARRMSATLYSVATVGRVAVLILFSYISIYPDVLICHSDSSIITADIHGVNPEIAACPGGRKPFAVAPAPGA